MNAGHANFPGRPVAHLTPNPKLKFLDQCREVMRFKQLARRTEETYLQWIRRFILFHRGQVSGGPPCTAGGPPALPRFTWRHLKDVGAPEVRAFLTDLAARGVSASAQNLALGLVES